MADVTDSAFRFIIAKHSKITPQNSKVPGAPWDYITYTEFVSADGLVLAPEEGRKKLLKDLEYTEIERPIVAQFFTSRPENMEKVARLALELGFDGVDINMGCPDKSIEKQGAGAGLIKTPQLARELIRAAKNGTEGKIPVSVKTRLGYNKDELEEWLPELLAESPAAITIHARTRKEMSKVPARWERVTRAVEIRNEIQNSTPNPLLLVRGGGEGGGVENQTLILGNGDLEDVNDALQKCQETGADGAMLGRAIFGNPWLFSPMSDMGLKERLGVLKEHIELFDKNLGDTKNFSVMKKHFKAYLAGFEGIHDLKNKLMESNSAQEAVDAINLYLSTL